MTQPIEITATPAAPHTCGCGGHGSSEAPVLDVRTIPHAIRHAAVFGAFEAIKPGEALVIIAPHAPLPLLSQLSERAEIDVKYLVEGPEEWHVQITRLLETNPDA